MLLGQLVLQRTAGNAQRPAPVPVLAGQAAQHGSLAGARLADQAERLAVLDGQVDVVQHLVEGGANAEAQVQRLCLDHGHVSYLSR
ncbi:hypothetical protein D3C76_1594860 [compost metagenome]